MASSLHTKNSLTDANEHNEDLSHGTTSTTTTPSQPFDQARHPQPASVLPNTSSSSSSTLSFHPSNCKNTSCLEARTTTTATATTNDFDTFVEQHSNPPQDNEPVLTIMDNNTLETRVASATATAISGTNDTKRILNQTIENKHQNETLNSFTQTTESGSDYDHLRAGDTSAIIVSTTSPIEERRAATETSRDCPSDTCSFLEKPQTTTTTTMNKSSSPTSSAAVDSPTTLFPHSATVQPKTPPASGNISNNGKMNHPSPTQTNAASSATATTMTRRHTPTKNTANRRSSSAVAATATEHSQQPRTLITDLQAHLDNEEISDVQLMGTDEKRVYAVRSLLAMRSRFFKSLFYGNFRERTLSEVPLNYSSLVLKAVVEYCYTDEIKTAFENLSFEETARAMVGLVSAGNYFELQGLMSRAYRLTCLMMDEYPALACAVLDESLEHSMMSSGQDEDCYGELSRVALGIIRLRTESSLMPLDAHAYGLGVQSLGARAMERVMAMNVDEFSSRRTDDKKGNSYLPYRIRTSELSLFLCLKKWAESGGRNNTHKASAGKRSQKEEEDRFSIAQQLALRIDLKRILPSDLSTHVANSGLVTIDQLAEAYREQALQAERQGMLFSTFYQPAGRRTTKSSTGNDNRRTRTNSNSSTGTTNSTVAAAAEYATTGTLTAISGKVMVQGAGLEAVNGTYKSQRSSGRYSRYGSITGCGKGEFFLHISRLQDDTKKWFLSFRGGGYYFDLYAAPSEAIATAATNSSSTTSYNNNSNSHNYTHWCDDDPPPMQKWLAVAPGHAQLRTLWRQTNNNYYYANSSNGLATASGGGGRTLKPTKEQGDGEEGTAGDPPPICIWIPDEP